MSRRRYISVDAEAPPGFEVISEPTRRDLRGGMVALWSRDPEALVARLGPLCAKIRGVLLCPGEVGRRVPLGPHLGRYEVRDEALPRLVELADALLEPYDELFELRDALALRDLELARERGDRMDLVDKLETETKALRGLLVARTAWTAAAMTALVELNAGELDRARIDGLPATLVRFLTDEPLALGGAELWFAGGYGWELQARAGALREVALPRRGGAERIAAVGDDTLIARFDAQVADGAAREALLVVHRPRGVDEAERSFLLLFTLQIAATYRARALHAALALALAGKDALIAELSTPVIQVWDGTVCVPVIGSIEAERAAQMTGALLDAVAARGLRHVIVDFTGAATMDTQTVRRFTDLARAIGLLGASCTFTGISAAVAQVLVGLGVDLRDIATERSVDAALRRLVGDAARPSGRRRGEAARQRGGPGVVATPRRSGPRPR